MFCCVVFRKVRETHIWRLSVLRIKESSIMRWRRGHDPPLDKASADESVT